MKHLWKISGKYAGVRSNDLLYNSAGKNVGYFKGDIAYSIHGRYLGEIINGDSIGKRSNIAYPVDGARAAFASIGISKFANRGGSSLAGWVDPDF